MKLGNRQTTLTGLLLLVTVTSILMAVLAFFARIWPNPDFWPALGQALLILGCFLLLLLLPGALFVVLLRFLGRKLSRSKSRDRSDG